MKNKKSKAFSAQQKRIYKDVEFLTNIRPYRNYRNTETLEKVCDYIKQEYEIAGLQYEEQKWLVDDIEYKNIIASYNPQHKRRLIIGAHYDVCGNQPGADDNASGVAGLLELSRLVAEQKPDIDYRIDFVAYCLEEPPFFSTEEMGSFIHAKSLHDNNVVVIGMICLEMIGYFSDKPNSQTYLTPEQNELLPHNANFIIVVGIEQNFDFNSTVFALMSEQKLIDVRYIHFPNRYGMAGLSDQSNYWKFNFPGVMINDTSFLRNPHYHAPTDTIEILDFAKMCAVINSILNVVSNIF